MSIEKKIPAVDSDISAEERNLLDESLERDITGDDLALERAELDNSDEDGEFLNEESSADDISGGDLDIPGAGDDDEDELIGEEDEENNGYSEADTE
ncbi:MAG: hypothetical protein ABI402_16505 [Ferruginibacter sp.]